MDNLKFLQAVRLALEIPGAAEGFASQIVHEGVLKMNTGAELKRSKADLQLISEHNRLVAQFKSEKRPGNQSQPTATGGIEQILASGQICVAFAHDLKPITIGQLRLHDDNKGSHGAVLVCRTIAEPVRQGSLITLVEDPIGDVMRIAADNICAPNEGTDRQLELSIVNHADLVYLEQTSTLLKDKQWLTPAPADSEQASWESLKRRGNELFVAGKFERAIVAYTDAIELKRYIAPNDPSALADLLANRAAAYLSDEKPMDAFWDCQSALNFKPGHEKASFRLAKAQANLGKYAEAKKALVACPHTTTPVFQAEIVRMNRLMRESQNGDFDLKLLLKEAAASDTPRLDHADYNGGVTVQWVSQQKGNGLVALRDFTPGDLLFVSKAFEAVFKPRGNVDNRSAVKDALRNECTARIIRRISKNADLAKEIRRFDAGRNFERINTDAPIVSLEALRVTSIVIFNDSVFGDTQEDTKNLCLHGSTDAPRHGFSFGDYGVWLLASFMNHSCSPNTIIFFVGDLMFVRAAKQIRKGEELTASYVNESNSLCCRYEERRKSLAKCFFVECECELCVCDLKRAEQRPDLAGQRRALLESYNALSVQRTAKYMLPAFAESVRKLAEEFSSRLAYKNRYDHCLGGMFTMLGNVYSDQHQHFKAAKAFEVAYAAVCGKGSFHYNLLTQDVVLVCSRIAHCYLRCRNRAKAKEYLGKIQSAAKIAWGSADKELLEMLHAGVDFDTLFKCK